MKFQQIRSATAIVTFGGSRFLIDPWLAPKDACPPIPGSANPDLRCPVHELPLPLEQILVQPHCAIVIEGSSTRTEFFMLSSKPPE